MLWSISGGAFVAAAVVLAVFVAMGLAILAAIFGLALIALAWDGRRRNAGLGQQDPLD